MAQEFRGPTDLGAGAQIPAPTLGDSKMPITPIPRNLIPSSEDTCTYMCTHTHTNKIKNVFINNESNPVSAHYLG